MNFNVYIEDALGKKIDHIAAASGKKRNHIIREALAQWVMEHYPADWPDSVKAFYGASDFAGFESFRNELENPEENLFQ